MLLNYTTAYQKTFQYLFANSINCNLVSLKTIRFIMRSYKLLRDFVKQSETLRVQNAFRGHFNILRHGE